VFISYSRKDYIDENKQIIPGNIVSKIRELFDSNNITYWFDEEGVYSGDAFAPIIARNIKDANIFLFISSENSNVSEWTSNEIATAHAYKKKIIPFKYDNSVYNDSVILYIARLDHIEYTKNPDKALSRLLQSVQNYLNEDIAKQEQKRQEEEAKRLIEISQQERSAKLRDIRTKIEVLEKRKLEIDKDILTKEHLLADLRSENRIIESKMSELRTEESFVLGENGNVVTKQPQKTYLQELKDTFKESYTIKGIAKWEWGIIIASVLIPLFGFVAIFILPIRAIVKKTNIKKNVQTLIALAVVLQYIVSGILLIMW